MHPFSFSKHQDCELGVVLFVLTPVQTYQLKRLVGEIGAFRLVSIRACHICLPSKVPNRCSFDLQREVMGARKKSEFTLLHV